MFTSKNLKEMNIELLVKINIHDFKNLYIINKHIYNLCDSNFWYLKFKHDLLPLPQTSLITVSEWIYTYIYICKQLTYSKHVMNCIKNNDNVLIQFDSLTLFVNKINTETYRKCYIAWQTLLNDYVSDLKQQYDENVPCGELIIHNVDMNYELTFNINKHTIKYNVDHTTVIDLLYNLILSYKYPYLIHGNDYYHRKIIGISKNNAILLV
jgi:hypothetical protein